MGSLHLILWAVCWSSAAFGCGGATPNYRNGVLEQQQKQSVAKYVNGKYQNSDRNSSRGLHGVHVCTRSSVLMVPVREMQSYCKPVYQSYLKRCDGGREGLCTGYRMVYELAYRSIQRFVPKTQSSYACCPGWTQGNAYEAGCKRAICRQPCRNGGQCIRPDHCLCLPGWTGNTCETDVDECGLGRHGCDQTCTNAQGSYRCSCKEGFTLKSDQKSCAKEESKRSTDCDSELLKKTDQLQKRLDALEEWQRQISLEVRHHPREDQIISLSEQMAILEETMEKCSCYKRSSTGSPKL